jgi:hypothetical protein
VSASTYFAQSPAQQLGKELGFWPKAFLVRWNEEAWHDLGQNHFAWTNALQDAYAGYPREDTLH